MSDYYIFHRVLDVIYSCKTSNQFKSAHKYADLFLEPLKAAFVKEYPGHTQAAQLVIYEKVIFNALNGKCLALNRERINDQLLRERDLGLRFA